MDLGYNAGEQAGKECLAGRDLLGGQITGPFFPCSHSPEALTDPELVFRRE